MKTIMVRYKVKADRATENMELIEQVFAQLKSEQPDGLHYASFKLEDGRSFVHIASLTTGDGSNPLGVLAAFKAFTAQIKDRCEDLPVAVDMTELGAYRFFAAN